jgi:hypothetical protein
VRLASDASLAYGLLVSSLLALGVFVFVAFRPPHARELESPAAVTARPTVTAGTEFVDVTEKVGLGGFKHQSEQGVRSIADVVAPGLGLLDLDGDGDLDLVLLGGPGAPTGVSILLNRLAESHELRFDDVTDECGITWRGAAQGICAGDVDADGDVDLFVTALDGNALFLNQLADSDALTFTEQCDEAGLVGGTWHWESSDPTNAFTRPGPGPEFDENGERVHREVPEFSTGASFGDVDADGDLDLYVANYLSYFPERVARAQSNAGEHTDRAEPLEYQPNTFESQPDRFYLNESNDDEVMFVNKTGAAHVVDDEGRGLGAVFMLIDDDFYPDVYVANDESPNVFLHNVGTTAGHGDESVGRRFDDATLEYGLLDRGSGMGIARGDADSDSDLDLLATNFRNNAAALFLFEREQRQESDGSLRSVPYFRNVRNSDKTGLYDATRPFVGWGCVFFDYDNDGDEDLFIGNGYTSPRVGDVVCKPEKPLLFENTGSGRFVEVAASAGSALARLYSIRGVVTGDLDQDGDLDLVFAQNHGPVVVLENRLPANGNHSLTLAVNYGPMPSAPGAAERRRADAVNVQVVAEVGDRKLVTELLSGGSYLSQGPFEAHFGLGRRTRADRVRVTWPFKAAPPPTYVHDPATSEPLPLLEGRHVVTLEASE